MQPAHHARSLLTRTYTACFADTTNIKEVLLFPAMKPEDAKKD